MMFETAASLSKKLQNQELSSVDLLKQSYDRVDAVDRQIKAFLSFERDKAFEAAEAIDEQRKSGKELAPLAGIPIAVKDNICIQNEKVTCASKLLENYRSPYDASVVTRLKSEGLIPLGKCNMDEFAMGSSTETSAFFNTSNPWDLLRSPGGSSGGSAAAVASGQAPLSLGSDTGGSIRQPAAFCGICGLKPTYGRVSRFGLVAFASSLDQIGPFAHSVEDIALLSNSIFGYDANDSTSAKLDVPDFTKALVPDIKGLKIAVPKELFGDLIDPRVKQEVAKALDTLKSLGASWEEIDIPSLKASVSTYYILAPAEASANLARFDGVRYTERNKDAKSLDEMYKTTRGEGFGPEVKRRILLGTFALSSGYYDAYYGKAQRLRSWIKQEFDQAFETYDVILSPTTPELPFKIGERSDDPMSMYMADIATIPANMTGLPGLSIPCGFSEGLPVGLQIVGKAFDEETVLRLGYTFQEHSDFHKKFPEIKEAAV